MKARLRSIFLTSSRYGGDSMKLGWFITLCVVVIGLVVAVSVAANLYGDKQSCIKNAEVKGYDYDWSVWGGCIYADDPDSTIEVIQN